ncbi:FtsX-like permease family protein [Parapedobacter sp. DT-150]|uniref:ABC transporter permease n=1 Tax=Parapedobacter sp. DT-150 TaxID=3396162 RepID=UPI003F19774F
MIRNYIKTAWRNLLKNKRSSFINIVGLALGMGVFILIALWIWDELSYDKHHKNYGRIGRAIQLQTWNGEVYSGQAIPRPLEQELKTNYHEHLQYIVMASWEGTHVLSHEDKNLTQDGIYMDADGPKMLSLDIIHGSIDGLQDPSSVMLSRSAAKAFFGDEDPLNRLMKIDQKLEVKVTAVYEDLPYNTTFRNLKFIAPWSLYVTSEPWVTAAATRWGNNSFQLFAQIPEGSNFASVNAAIINAKQNNVPEEDKKFNAQITLQPMKDWHLRNEWKGGKVVGGLIEYVKLFSIIGVFVLLLACINFMNLSTARSEKRAKEVGIRKTVGSARRLIIAQFLSESVLIALIAFLLSILLVMAALPWFNDVADKKMYIPWLNGWFWGGGLLFSILTGLVAGSYPAFYLSSFNPLKVLKGTFRAGKLASVPRKVLVVVQFTISVALVIGTIVVFRQIQYTKDRPVGYNRDRLMMAQMVTPDFYGKFDVLRAALKEKNTITEMSLSSSPLTDVWSNNGGFDWEGKDPDLSTDFATIWVTHEHGQTIDWYVNVGRDFSRAFAMDSTAIIINEAAVKFMGIKDPVGKVMKWDDTDFRIIGVVDDIVMSSPFEPVKQAVYLLSYDNVNWMNFKLNPHKSTAACVEDIQHVFKEVVPNAPFEYKFADSEYAEKFAQEERVGQLATFFAVLAVVISSLGVFGLASFVAEQRTKEIGIRKIVGASIFQLWKLLSTDLVALVFISCVVAIPIAYYFLHEWLQKYTYRSALSWWIFAAATIGALLITMVIVSIQTIKAATANPVDSLRDE